MKDLVIFGSGGHAREMIQILHDINAADLTWNVIGMLDDNAEAHQTQVAGKQVLGGVDWLRSHKDVAVVIAIGGSAARNTVARRIHDSAGNRFATLVHPEAWIGRRATLGEGCMIFPGASISTDVILGNHVIVNFGASISHDSSLGDFATIGPGATICGGVTVAEGCNLGANSTVIPSVSVDSWSVIGAGAVVINDIEPNATAVGNPARIISVREAGWHESARPNTE